MAKRKTETSKVRRFNLPWGQGDIVEEASFVGEYHDSRVQLLKADEGYVMVRFCYYDLDGRFQRSPMIVGEDDLKGLKASMRDCPQLCALLKTLTG